jgi:small basic protein (TIGR04137 family)
MLEMPISFLRSYIMSQHSSLRSANKIRVKRNVLKRFERVQILKEQGRWKDGDKGTGLPKTKSE